MIKFRPSHLSAISQCPRFVRTETPPKEMDEAAEEGTDFHAEMERVAKADDHAAALAALPEGPAKVYAAWCWESIQGILDAGGEIIGAEVTVPESSVAKQGTADLLLAENVGDVVSTKGTGGMCFDQRLRHGIGPIFANQVEELPHLPRKNAIGVGQPAQIWLCFRSEQRH